MLYWGYCHCTQGCVVWGNMRDIVMGEGVDRDVMVDWGRGNVMVDSMMWSCMVDSMMGSCMVNSMMGSCMMYSMMWFCMMDSMVRNVMVDSMMWSRMVDNMVGSVVGDWVMGVSQRVPVLIQLGFGIVRIVGWVRIQTVERGGLGTVNLVPIFAGELILVKQCSVGTKEACTVGTVSTVITYSVGLTS